MTDPQMYLLLGSGLACYVSGFVVNLFSTRRRIREPFVLVFMIGFLALITAGGISLWQSRPKQTHVEKTECTTLL